MNDLTNKEWERVINECRKSTIILTAQVDLISQSGNLMLRKGCKYELLSVKIREEFWGKMSGQYYPPIIGGVILKDYPETNFDKSVFSEIEIIGNVHEKGE
jgi:hypothetical protein